MLFDFSHLSKQGWSDIFHRALSGDPADEDLVQRVRDEVLSEGEPKVDDEDPQDPA